MGGTVIETESEKLIRQGKNEGKRESMREGKAQLLIEMGLEEGLTEASILKKLQDKIDLTLEQATAYLDRYGKQLV